MCAHVNKQQKAAFQVLPLSLIEAELACAVWGGMGGNVIALSNHEMLSDAELSPGSPGQP